MEGHKGGREGDFQRKILSISPLLADFESGKQVPTEVEQFDKFLVKMQDAHDMYLSI